MRITWSRAGFILAAVGSALGLGNIWRFPYIVGVSGGGSFLIPYIIAIAFFGLPLMFLEISTGRKYKGSIVTTFKRLDPKIKLLAIVPIITTFSILSYYLVITGMTLAYFIFSFIGFIEFSKFTQTIYPVVFFIISAAVVAAIVKTGIKRGIEKICVISMPILFLLFLILLIKSITLPNAIEGILFFLTPDFNSLFDPSIWVLAFGQAFFSLSVGWGILLTYGSYLHKKENIPKDSIIVVGTDFLAAIISGLIIFSIIFSFGLNPAAGAELAFVALPHIFSVMGGGMIFGAMFFLILFIAAITSAISIFEVSVSAMIDELHIDRTKSSLILFVPLILLGLPSALSYSGYSITLFEMPFLDAMDYIFGTLLTPITAALVCVVLSWAVDPKEIVKEINRNSKVKIPHFIIHILRYIVPGVLLIFFLFKILGMNG